MRQLVGIGIFGLTLWLAAGAWSYPLDGYPYTGILRLEGFRLAQQGKVQGIRLPPGALLPSDQVDLRLLDNPDFRMPPADPEFTMAVKRLLGDEADRYGLAVLDLTDLQHSRYMEHQGTDRANPGSVGKIIVALGIFQALADIYPDDIAKRIEILRTAEVTADEFILTDQHNVPLWTPNADRVSYRPVQTGDRANLWTYLDWMMSASSNAAASMVMRELMLLVHFGTHYPVSPDVSRRFFSTTPKKELGDLLARALQTPITRSGLDLEQLRQGSFFTSNGKKLVPGTTSYATPREMMHYLIKLEQGKLVDTFSSREIKRLLYMTQGRIRYASSPALGASAVYFKSGSLYKCQPEPGFTCRKYHGNVLNMLNSVATVESPAGEHRLFYLVTVMSNVLRKNSAVVHQTVATRIHRLIEAYHGRSAATVKGDNSGK
jgi:hypothetical protein